VSSASIPPTSPVRRASPALAFLVGVALLVSLAPPGVRGDTPPDHLVVSEVVTGGASASDELIELHNPTPSALPLEGLELVYVTASGATVSRRAAWALGAPEVAPGRHVLVANEAGIYAGIADATYASGMAATGGSVALRILGASSAIDAVGWGTSTSAWREGAPAAVAPSGASIERLPGGALGSTRDTNDNAADFVVRDVPDPQNLGAAPTPDPLATATPMPTATPAPTDVPPTAEPTPIATIVPTAAPTPDGHVSIATARALPDGTLATIEGVAVTSSDFADGGGFVADETGGIAVLIDGGSYARGARLRVVGTLDDRFAQRTLRVAAADVTTLGTGPEPAPTTVGTGAVTEAVEGRLVRVEGTIAGAPTELSSGTAYDVDDGSGQVRVLVGPATGIALAAWTPGATVSLVGVVGQRDSSGTGVAGYRVQPRDTADVLAVTPGTEPTATPSTGVATPVPSATPEPVGVVSIAAARELPKNSRVRVRGTVTMPTGIVDEVTAVIQDASGAIVLRLGDDAGSLAVGRAVEVDGTRSTKTGMETVRVTTPPRDLGSAAEPSPRLVRTGEVGESAEALLVTVRGGLVASARRASTGSVSFEIDDGSGPLRISVDAVLSLDDDLYVAGTWVEVRGVVGQETTGSQPLRGYRIWPRAVSDLRIVASATEGTTPSGGESGGGTANGDSRVSNRGNLDSVGQPGAGDLVVAATLVAGPWPELGIGGLLWDGTRLVAIAGADAERVESAIGRLQPPMAVELSGLRAVGEGPLGMPLVRLARGTDALAIGVGPAARPGALRAAGDHRAPRWVAAVGRRAGSSSHPVLVIGRTRVDVEQRCEGTPPWPSGPVAVRGIATGVDRPTIVIGCQGVVPAPHLGAARDSVGPADGPSAARVAGLGSPAESPTPWVPGVLLGLAAGALGGAALLVRRLAVGDDPDGADASAPDGLDAETGPSVASSTGPPVLTLVTLPRERAP
jgi:hypothetical protein